MNLLVCNYIATLLGQKVHEGCYWTMYKSARDRPRTVIVVSRRPRPLPNYVLKTMQSSVLARLFSGGAAPLGCHLVVTLHHLVFTIFTTIPVMIIRFW